jgi:hypothetical protein
MSQSDHKKPNAEYTAQLQAFIRAVIDDDSANMLAQIKPARQNEIFPKERLAVYRNAYLIRLENALAVDYPATGEYLGLSVLHDLITKFVLQTPSLHWDLNLYSIAFADFLQAENISPKACALAQIESAITQMFWGRRLYTQGQIDVQNLSIELLASQAFMLNPACKLLCLDYAANVYLTAQRAGDAPEDIAKQREYLAIIRHENEVKRLPLSKEAHHLLNAISKADHFEAALLQTAEHADMDQDALIAQLPDIIETCFRYQILLPKDSTSA